MLQKGNQQGENNKSLASPNVNNRFYSRLRLELTIITNELNSINLNKVKKIAKNIKSTSLINKNMLAAITILAVVKIKELKAQILELKVKLKDLKYILREDRKLSSTTKGNQKSHIKNLIRNL